MDTIKISQLPDLPSLLHPGEIAIVCSFADNTHQIGEISALSLPEKFKVFELESETDTVYLANNMSLIDFHTGPVSQDDMKLWLESQGLI